MGIEQNVFTTNELGQLIVDFDSLESITNAEFSGKVEFYVKDLDFNVVSIDIGKEVIGVYLVKGEHFKVFRFTAYRSWITESEFCLLDVEVYKRLGVL